MFARAWLCAEVALGGNAAPTVAASSVTHSENGGVPPSLDKAAPESFLRDSFYVTSIECALLLSQAGPTAQGREMIPRGGGDHMMFRPVFSNHSFSFSPPENDCGKGMTATCGQPSPTGAEGGGAGTETGLQGRFSQRRPEMIAGRALGQAWRVKYCCRTDHAGVPRP